jgi:uncharacterized protein YqhQ
MKPSGIGGQAVIEGIMMRNKDKYSIAVRKPDNDIEVTVRDCSMLTEKYKWLNYPIIRGVFNFVDSLVTGISTINYSASFYDDPSEQKSTKADEVGKAVFKDKLEAVLMAFTVIVSVVIAVGLFMLLPYFISRLLAGYVASQFMLNFLEGVVRVAIFMLYIVAISRMNDIKRTFMYHGAEHKCINCVEHGARLTPENVKNSSRFHRRCGTSFLFLVMFVSIIFFIFIRVDNTFLQLLIRILLIPVIAGVSYELIRWAGRSENPVINAISLPGLWMQRLTTKEPDMDMIEVAIKAVEEVFDWETFLVEYYKDSEEPEAEMSANEASLALTAHVKTSADKNTRSLNPDEVVSASDISQETAEQQQEQREAVQEHQVREESPDETDGTIPEEDQEESDELPDGFEIIEDETAAADEELSEKNEEEKDTLSAAGETETDVQTDDEDDGFEFIEDNDEPDNDYAEDVPLFKQRADKRR